MSIRIEQYTGAGDLQQVEVYDLGAQTYTRYDGAMQVVESRPLTAAKIARWTPSPAAVNEEAIRSQVAQALTANRTDKTTNDAYLAIASPTNAQNLAQIRELSRQSSRQARQLNQLIRQTYRLFDGTD